MQIANLTAAILFSCSLFAVAWKDPSKHQVRFINVEPGVKLEVLDWGGSGETILLLAGHGNTGHIFDDFAPLLAKDFRVFALTRRGFGASSQPEESYDLTRMVQDIAQVTDALKLKRVHLVGHSIAGDEMTRFARTFPNQTGKLIYLDAAYDRVEAQRIEATFPRLPPAPGPAPADLASPQAMGDYIARTHIPMPEAEVRATRIFDSNGHYLREVTPDRILGAVAKMVEHPDYTPVHAKILAIYAVYQTPSQLLLRNQTADPETRKLIEQIFDIWRASAEGQRECFRMSVPQARVVELEGANHYVFISHSERVLAEIRSFLKNRK